MRISLEIPDDMIPQIEQFIGKYHVTPKFTETGAQYMDPNFTPLGFLEDYIERLLVRVAEEFPPASVQQTLEQIEALKASIVAATKVTSTPETV